MSDPLEVITRLEELERAVPPAPWHHRLETDEERINVKFHDRIMMDEAEDFVILREANADHPSFQGRPDVEIYDFVATYRNAAPALLKALRCLLEERAAEVSSDPTAWQRTHEATNAALKELSEVKL